MATYHVNPISGVPALCNAAAGRCPYGGADRHGATAQEAVRIFESNFTEIVAAPVAKAKSKPVAGGVAHPELRNTGRHGESMAIAAAVKGPGRGLPQERFEGSLCSDRVNPLSREGVPYPHRSDDIIILGTSTGSRLRAMGGRGVIFQDPSVELGRPVRLIKHRAASGEGHIDLVVLGYHCANGDKYGFVPSKKLHYFAFC